MLQECAHPCEADKTALDHYCSSGAKTDVHVFREMLKANLVVAGDGLAAVVKKFFCFDLKKKEYYLRHLMKTQVKFDGLPLSFLCAFY